LTKCGVETTITRRTRMWLFRTLAPIHDGFTICIELAVVQSYTHYRIFLSLFLFVVSHPLSIPSPIEISFGSSLLPIPPTQLVFSPSSTFQYGLLFFAVPRCPAPEEPTYCSAVNHSLQIIVAPLVPPVDPYISATTRLFPMLQYAVRPDQSATSSNQSHAMYLNSTQLCIRRTRYTSMQVWHCLLVTPHAVLQVILVRAICASATLRKQLQDQARHLFAQ
jgi:hypothetical protein